MAVNPMTSKSSITESIWIQFAKTLLLALSAFGYTFPLVTGVAHILIPCCVLVSSLFAFIFAWLRIRPVWCVLIAAFFIITGFSGSYLTLNIFGITDVAMTIQGSRFWYFIGLIFGLVFLSRSLSLRYRTAQIIEFCAVNITLVYIFFAHRDFNLTHPREFADYLYSNGYDPIEIYRWMGLGASFLSLPLLIGKAKPLKVIYSLATIAILALLLATLSSDWRLPVNTEDPLGLKENEDEQDQNNDDSDDNNDSDSDDNKDSNGGGSDDNNQNNNSGGGSGNNGYSNSPNNSPTPVAVAIFYDEYEPWDGLFHFRQNVLSKYDGNHLVSSDIDKDVISTYPADGDLVAEPLQNAEMHSQIATSMFLMMEHAQPPQVAMGQKLSLIQNPDPKLYVAAYSVESLGLTLDLSRLIGHRSIPSSWPQEKVDHYLAIPDDPRYKALSDIIVRQIDPRFVGDDVIKAWYIKSWLEKEGYYTQKTKHIDTKDPTASFLFGSLRGYCVHFAHAAVYLLRSQGIAARVAIGYAVDNRLRGTNSAVLILGNQAHAWPEIYLDGVGWVTLDIFPENGDEPPREFIDQELESLFGELARNDKSGGKADDAIDHTFSIPWHAIWMTLLGLLILALLGSYTRKIIILIMGYRCDSIATIHRPAKAVVMIWSMYGHPWRKFSTLEEFAAQTAGPESATAQLMGLASAASLGSVVSSPDPDYIHKLYQDARREAANKTKFHKILIGWLNPIVRI